MDKEISGVVVGVAGLGGLRESTIVKRLTEKLPGSATIFFDGYSVKMPKDFRRWLDAGADFDEWIAPGIASDLEVLLADLSERTDV